MSFLLLVFFVQLHYRRNPSALGVFSSATHRRSPLWGIAQYILRFACFLNLHYSLLPAFGGVIGFKTLEMAKEANTQIVGVTCHYVSEKVDAGKVISQAAIPVDWDAPFDIIGNRIFRIACECFLNGLLLVCNQSIGYSSFNNNVLYSPQLRYDNSLFTESFWHLIKEL